VRRKKMRIYKTLILSIAILAILLLSICSTVIANEPLQPIHRENTNDPPEYQILFFRHDGRIWIELPRGTSLVEIHQSYGNRQGWVRAYNQMRQPLVLDNRFHGHAITSAAVSKAVFPNHIVTTTHDGKAIGIFTPANSRYVEIISEKNGFDGVVTVMDKNRNVLARQSGLDIKITNYRQF
jgi:hypothetical protein